LRVPSQCVNTWLKRLVDLINSLLKKRLFNRQ
jgi:hypothetical protein